MHRNLESEQRAVSGQHLMQPRIEVGHEQRHFV